MSGGILFSIIEGPQEREKVVGHGPEKITSRMEKETIPTGGNTGGKEQMMS